MSTRNKWICDPDVDISRWISLLCDAVDNYIKKELRFLIIRQIKSRANHLLEDKRRSPERLFG